MSEKSDKTVPAAESDKSPERVRDEKWMAVALDHARTGRPSPNPHVGAAIVSPSGEELISTGHHERAGTDHAEVMALKLAGGLAKGCTLYVTLEPCNHTGRTPPCTDEIIKAGIKRVVIGCKDPNPHVAGGGEERLRAAGVEVTVGIREDEAAQVIAPWVKYVTLGLPYVSLKLALSLDGRIATRTGASKWVTGQDARARVHSLRAKHDAVGVGIGTALADDPRLTVRDAPGLTPLRVIFDTKLRVSTESRLVKTASQFPTWVLCGEDAPEENESVLTGLGVGVLRCPRSAEGRIDVAAALRMLCERGIVSLMVEGGAELAGSFLAARLADELHAFVAPILLGPRGRPGAVDWAGPDAPTNAPRIGKPKWELCGEDAYVHGRLMFPEG
jgi:diaminohydroxyphosphoribosylaminopyrimidine deaminase/5-amino-6-(5-phosphoribosylamino)uracil reductase